MVFIMKNHHKIQLYQLFEYVAYTNNNKKKNQQNRIKKKKKNDDEDKIKK